jgi:hypothetical protein
MTDKMCNCVECNSDQPEPRFQVGMLVRIAKLDPDDDEFFSSGDKCRLIRKVPDFKFNDIEVWDADFNGFEEQDAVSDGLWSVSEAQIEPVDEEQQKEVEVITFGGNAMQDLKDSLEKAITGGESIPEGICISCKKPFSDDNVFTAAGWRETKVSKMCEKCFDKLWQDC